MSPVSASSSSSSSGSPKPESSESPKKAKSRKKMKRPTTAGAACRPRSTARSYSFQRQFSQIRSRADGFGHPVPWPLPVPLASPRLLFNCPWTYGIPPDFCFESLSCPDLPNGDLKYVLQSGSKQSERHPPRLLPETFFFAVWSAQGLSGLRTDSPCSGASHSRCNAPHRTNEAWRGDCK